MLKVERWNGQRGLKSRPPEVAVRVGLYRFATNHWGDTLFVLLRLRRQLKVSTEFTK